MRVWLIWFIELVLIDCSKRQTALCASGARPGSLAEAEAQTGSNVVTLLCKGYASGFGREGRSERIVCDDIDHARSWTSGLGSLSSESNAPDATLTFP